MIDFTKNPEVLLSTAANLFKEKGSFPEIEIIQHSKISIIQSGYDEWDGGIYLYTIYLEIPIDIFYKYSESKKEIENSILETILQISPPTNDQVRNVVLHPALSLQPNWRESLKLPTKKDISDIIDYIRDTLIGTGTGKIRIQDVEKEFAEKMISYIDTLEKAKIQNPLPFNNLWGWYNYYKTNNLDTYAKRRIYISNIFDELNQKIKKFENNDIINSVFETKLGWPNIDNNVIMIKKTLFEADCIEKFQTVGLICRETLISLSQIIYNKEKHKTLDGIEPSKTDAKRMIESFISVEMGGSSNEAIRKLSKASLDVANDLTHRRTADFKLAALCAQSTISLINIIAIISEKKSFDL